MRYLFIIFFTIFSLHATESQSYKVNSLIDMSLLYHPNIKAAGQALRGADAGVDTAIWSYFPTPSVGVQRTSDNLHALTMSLQQPLWTGGKLSANYDIAKANKVDMQAALEESGYTLVENLLTAIKNYVAAQDTISALEEGQKQLNILEGMLSRRIAAGVSAKADMDLLQARLYQSDTDIKNAKMKKQVALSQIELFTGRRFGGGLDIAQQSQFDIDDEDLDGLVQDMLKSHPTLKRLDAQIDEAKGQKEKSKAEIWPSVSAVVQKNTGSSSLYYDLPSNQKAVAYLSVQANPGAGLSLYSSIQQSQAKIIQLEQEKLSKQQELIEKLMYAYNDYVNARDTVDAQSGSIGSAEKVFASYTRLFLAGKRQWLDLVNASRELTQNQIAYANTRATLDTSSYLLALLSGKIDSVVSLNKTDDSKTTVPIKADEADKTDYQGLIKINTNDNAHSPTFDAIIDDNTTIQQKQQP